MTDSDSIHEIVEESEELTEEASQLVNDAKDKVAETIADAYGFDPDDVNVSNENGHHFIATIEDSEQLQELQSNLSDDYTVKSSLEVEVGSAKYVKHEEMVDELLTIIEELEEQYDEGAPEKEVYDRAELELALSRFDVEMEVENLRRKGMLYEPRQDYFRTT